MYYIYNIYIYSDHHIYSLPFFDTAYLIHTHTHIYIYIQREREREREREIVRQVGSFYVFDNTLYIYIYIYIYIYVCVWCVCVYVCFPKFFARQVYNTKLFSSHMYQVS